jgi:hypothetical protein
MKTGKKLYSFGKAGLRSYLDEEGRENEAINTKPIADLIPETTVMFADIAGDYEFTMSSVFDRCAGLRGDFLCQNSCRHYFL